ncbi:hypothetical protein [Tenacibaculum ascidiaceicola]|uniref:hypothetical protein n=1 Tax=Tenacibaculum ascidiaceicola TaxID=1699411 RepID=UPI003CE4DF8E
MYISPIDLLNISIEELEFIDDKKIIRLEKHLKVLMLQNQIEHYNLEETQHLIQQLKDPFKRKAIIFIEEHPLFKQFITNGVANKPSVFNFKEKYKHLINTFSSFLAPYLNTYFIPFLKGDYQNKKYDIIIEALHNKDIFTSDLLFKVYQYIEQQTQLLIETIEDTSNKFKLYKKCPQVTNKSLIILLNSVPDGIAKDLKVNYANSLANYYIRTRINFFEYPKIKYAYQLVSKIEIDDKELKNQFNNISKLGNWNHSFLTPRSFIAFLFQIIFTILILLPLKIILLLITIIGLVLNPVVLKVFFILPLDILIFALNIIKLIISDKKGKKEAKDHLRKDIKSIRLFYKKALKYIKNLLK